MHNFRYFLKKIEYKLRKKNPEIINNYFRKKGIQIGTNTIIYSNILTGEPDLITIGNNVVIGFDVQLITHDYSVKKVLPEFNDLFGKINIGHNCFIGQRSTILYGVTLADNIIVSAGSVVTKSFYENNIIIGGNPAKIISNWEKFREKSVGKAQKKIDIKIAIKENRDIFVKK